MKNIGILGGSFDPIHHGHLIAAQCVYDTGAFDEIWVMPTGNPPHKDLESIANDHKLSMCELAIKNSPNFKVSDYELNREGKIYSVDTLEQLSNLYLDIKFWLIIGADSLLYLEKWYNAPKLLTIGNFIVVDRGGIDPDETHTCLERLKSEYDAEFMYVKMPLIELSSTNIRKRLKKGESVSYRLPEAVITYIEDKGLYR